MNGTCTRLDDLLLAARRGQLTDAERRHAASCGECSDALLLETLLREEGAAARSRSAPPALDHMVVRLRDRLHAETVRRARRLNFGLRIAGATLSVLGVLGSGLWSLRYYGSDVLGWLIARTGDLAAGGASSTTSPSALFAVAVAMAVSVLSYGLWSSWVEE